MIARRILPTICITAAIGLFSGSAIALDEADRDEVRELVREYLLENPEILLEVQTALEEKQAQLEAQERATVLAENADEIFNHPSDGVLGNVNGDVTIVEFFDYNCGFCQRAHEDMVTLLESDANLRFVLKEFPILGPDSQAAHTVSMAFKALQPADYGTYMDRLITVDGRATEQSAMELALEMGADEAALRDEMASPAIIESVESTYGLANALGITGTPSYVIGDEVISGALGSAVLAEKVANIRSCKSATC